MKKTMKWVFATAAALIACAFMSTSAFAGGSYAFSFGYNSGGHYRHGYPRYGGGYYPRYSYGVSYYYAPPVYYSPPPVVYRQSYSPAPVYYYSGGSFYCY